MLPPKDQMREFMSNETRFQSASAENEQEPMGNPDFGPPDFGDEDVPEHEFHNKEQLSEAYASFENSGAYEPELEGIYEDEEDPEIPPHWGKVKDSEYPVPPSLRQPGGDFIRDEPLFPGGPAVSEVNAWKKQFETDGHTVHLSEPASEPFIWRTMSRTEYRELMALPNTDPLQREEIICEICTLFPPSYNFSSMANRKAGVPAVLAEQIMHESGFKKPSPPIRL